MTAGCCLCFVFVSTQLVCSLTLHSAAELQDGSSHITCAGPHLFCVFCAAGFVGIETFSYTVQNTSLTAVVTVNVSVGSCEGSSCSVGTCNMTTGDYAAAAAAAAPAAPAAGLFTCTIRMSR
jgi:hypothetical protein